MKHSLFKRLAALGACCAMATTCAFAATTVYKTIKVEYAGVKLLVNGETVTPRDPNGNVVDPFIYNGTTYLPVRAVSNALGAEVGWDGNTKTVIINMDSSGGSTGGSSSSSKTAVPYEIKKGKVYSGTADSFSVMGKAHNSGFTLVGHSIASECYAVINTEGADTLTFDLGHVDGTGDAKLDLEIYLDDAYQETINVTATESSQTITIDLNGARNCKLKFAGKAGYFSGSYGFYNVTLE